MIDLKAGHFKLCVPLKSPTLAFIQRAQKHADLVELWIDTTDENQVKKLILSSKKPVIAVCKGKDEKGEFTGSNQNKIDKLLAAARAGARYIDIGSATPQNLIRKLKLQVKKTGAQLIISTHYWSNTPTITALEQHALALKKRGADVVKIATTLSNPADSVTLFELATRLTKRKLRFVVVGMGPLSQISRIGCALLGGEFTFVALDKKSITAPGQLHF